MTDLRDAILTAVSNDAKAIQAKEFPFRHHLGASLLGHSCERYLFFTFRWVQLPDFSSRTLRIFERGRDEEDRIIDKLRSIGMVIETIDPDTHKQIRASGLPAHIGGSLDGIVWTPANYVDQYGYRMPIECKTHNRKSFTKTFNDKELSASYPQHFTQGNIYGYAMQSSHFMYIGLCKDNDELDIRFCKTDDVSAKIYIQRGVNVVYSPNLRNIQKTDEIWRCKMCDFKTLCHSSKPATSRNCRSCVHFSPIEDGTWLCQNTYQAVAQYDEITTAEQCPHWMSIL